MKLKHNIDLSDDMTLKGYRRRGHELNGKDADLDYGGQVYVKEGALALRRQDHAERILLRELSA